MSKRRKTVNRFGVEIETDAYWAQPTPEQYVAACEAFIQAMQPHRNITRFRTEFYTGTKTTRQKADEFDAGFAKLRSKL